MSKQKEKEMKATKIPDTSETANTPSTSETANTFSASETPKPSKTPKPPRTPTMGEAGFVMLMLAVILIGGSILKLRYELLMILVALVAALVAILRCHISWSDLEESISLKMKSAVPTMMLIWCTGMMIAALIYSGSVPMIIYYGLKVIDPRFIYVSAFLLCAIMSTATGSSWSSAGTVGIAVFGMAMGMGANLPVVVGAIITGSIFGDKLSPLSETTNMAPACAGTDIYSHIRSMLWTTIPPSLIGCVIWGIVGFTTPSGSASSIESVAVLSSQLKELYHFNILLLLPFVIILYCAIAKKPVIPCMITAIIVSLLLGWLIQGFSLERGFYFALNGFNIHDIAPNFKGSADLMKLLQRGGAKSMAGIIIMCFSGFSCAAILSRAGFLDKVLSGVNTKLNSRPKAMGAAIGTNLFIMIATGTAYISFIIVSEMYKKIFAQNKMGAQVLSRSLEDIGTCVGCLIPWSLSGVYYATLFSVPIFGSGGYAIWTVLPYVTPVFAMFWAFTGLGMYPLTDEQRDARIKQIEAEQGK